LPLTVAGAASASTRVLAGFASYRVPIFIDYTHDVRRRNRHGTKRPE
jgi:hypothetical protein